MRALVQRVSRAAVRVEGEILASIGPGLLVLLGVGHDDTEASADRLADKVRTLRIFADAEGRMNEPLRSGGCAARVVANRSVSPRMSFNSHQLFAKRTAAGCDEHIGETGAREGGFDRRHGVVEAFVERTKRQPVRFKRQRAGRDPLDWIHHVDDVEDAGIGGGTGEVEAAVESAGGADESAAAERLQDFREVAGWHLRGRRDLLCGLWVAFVLGEPDHGAEGVFGGL